MCGIVGAMAFGGASLDGYEAAAAASLDSIRHRGPDDEGTYWNDARSVFLGHRRLSIIDLSAAGHQPMSNEDGTVWIVYNGEVYNFPELHDELVAKGHVFRSRTDTEVIVHGYEEWGDAIIERLRGMFAFGLYDSRKDRLLLARDRVGIKTLYYTRANDRLIFASEIKAILEYPGVDRALDVEALREYLAFGKAYSPKTMFRGIYKLPAGHRAVAVTSAELRPERYWSPYETKLDLPPAEDEKYYTNRLLELLQESVRLRMLSDVPVGVFLSGGVDSTANVALMSRVAGGDVHTLTAGFQGQETYDERKYARQAAEHYGTTHDEIEIVPRDLVDTLPELSYYLDEPIADPTVVPIYFLSKLARQKGAIVILNGDGGDELFCGYNKYMRYLKIAPYWRALNAMPRPIRRAMAGVGGALVGEGAAYDLLQRSARGVEMYVGSTGALTKGAVFGEISHANGNGGIYRAVQEGQRAFAKEHKGSDYAEWLAYWGIRSEIEHVFLYRADRMGMANSIEIRVPFLDHRLVEFAMQMPQSLKYKNGETKYILKKALEGVVPNDLLYRKKQGFCVPIREWAGEMMTETIVAGLPRLRREWNAFSEELEATLLKRVREERDEDGSLLWNLYSLVTWYERWFA